MSAAPDSWYHEKESAWLYGRVAAAEPDPVRRAMFQKLGAAAEQQALRWQALEPARTFHFSPSLRARLVAEIVRRIGPRASRHALAAMKLRGLSVYTSAAPPVAPEDTSTTSLPWRRSRTTSATSVSSQARLSRPVRPSTNSAEPTFTTMRRARWSGLERRATRGGMQSILVGIAL